MEKPTYIWMASAIAALLILTSAALAPNSALASILDWKPTYTTKPIQYHHRYACPQILRPVCGINGVTYDNSCQARSRAVPIAHYGACGSNPTPRPTPYFFRQPTPIPVPTPLFNTQRITPLNTQPTVRQVNACPQCPNCIATIGICPNPALMHYSPNRY